MKIGDLVEVSNGFPCILSPFELGSQEFMEWKHQEFLDWKSNSMREVKVEFKVGEIGTVLEVGGKNYFNENNVRILVPRGIGWCSQHWVEVIS